MVVRFVFSAQLLVFVLIACGGHRSAHHHPTAAPPGAGRAGVDPAVELAARLPRGAESCAVARSGALSSHRRSLYRRLSHGDPLAFHPGAPFVAVATAVRTLADRRRVRVVLIRASADRETVRRFLDEHSGLRLDWSPGAAPRLGVVRARFLDERTVELANGRFPESPPRGAQAPCAVLAALHREALEVASRRGEWLLPNGIGAHPERIEYRVFSSELHLRIERTMTMTGEGSGFVGGIRTPDFGFLPAAVLAESTDESEDGRRFLQARRFRWEDLALAARDERRVLAATLADAAAHEPQSADSVDVSDLEAVRLQRELWRTRLGGIGIRAQQATHQLRILLERAITAHPREADLRRDLFELLARVVGDAPAAAGVAAAAVRDGVGDAAEFAQLRREALAQSDLRALADALAADGVLPRRITEGAARALGAAVLEGADYSFAEAAFLAGRALLARAYRGAGHRVAPTRLDLETLPDALAILAEAGGVAGSLWISVEGARPSWGIEAFDSERAPRVALDVGRDLLLGAANTGSTLHLSSLGASIANALEPGPIVVSFFIVPFGGAASRPSAWGRLEGELVDGRLTLERVAGPGARIPWGRVRRYLTKPLADSRARRFPPPTVTIEAESTAHAEALVTLDDAHPELQCTRDARALVCSPAPASPDALRGLLVEFASQHLVTLSSALLTR